MIKLAKNAEANAKLKPKKANTKTSINLPLRWIHILFIALLAFQIYLNISAYYAVMSGMKNFSLFVVGVMMLVFAGMFHLYRHGRSIIKSTPHRAETVDILQDQYLFKKLLLLFLLPNQPPNS